MSAFLRLRRFRKNFAQERESLVFYRIVIPAVRMRDEFIANLQTGCAKDVTAGKEPKALCEAEKS